MRYLDREHTSHCYLLCVVAANSQADCLSWFSCIFLHLVRTYLNMLQAVNFQNGEVRKRRRFLNEIVSTTPGGSRPLNFHFLLLARHFTILIFPLLFPTSGCFICVCKYFETNESRFVRLHHVMVGHKSIENSKIQTSIKLDFSWPILLVQTCLIAIVHQTLGLWIGIPYPSFWFPGCDEPPPDFRNAHIVPTCTYVHRNIRIWPADPKATKEDTNVKKIRPHLTWSLKLLQFIRTRIQQTNPATSCSLPPAEFYVNV